MNQKKRDRLVIIGCGFGGLALAKKLSMLPLEILVIDKNNFHTFQPLLYQVATGGLEAENIVYPVRKIFRKHPRIFFRMAEVTSVRVEEKLVTTTIGEIAFDYLVMAQGSTDNYLSFEPDKHLFFPLKSLSDALNLRSKIMQNLERSLVTRNYQEREEAVNIAIVGAGPTGLELAGAIAEMKKYVLPLDFPELDLSIMHIYLFEAAPRILGSMSESASAHALDYLVRLGVELKTETRVTGYDGHQLLFESGESILTSTVIWTAGVKAMEIKGFPGTSYLKNGRLKVDEFNRVLNCRDIFAIGDAAAHASDSFPKGMPMLAPVAIQQAKQLAGNIGRLIQGKPMVPFAFRDKGVMATIGRKRAVADLRSWKLHGLFAWLIWMFIHIMSLIGFKNKLLTFIQWSGSYFSYDKPLGIIIPTTKRKE